MLLHQFHDILPGSSIARVYEEAEAAYEKIHEETDALTKQAAGGLLDSADGVTAFNSLGFERKALICLPDAFVSGAKTAEGEAVPVERTKEGAKALVTLPSCGAVSLIPAEEGDCSGVQGVSVQETAEGFVMENSLVKAVVSRKGEVTSFILKESGREFAAAPMNRFRLFKDVPRLFDAWDIDSNYVDQEIPALEEASVSVEKAAGLEAVLVLTGKIGGSCLTQRISLAAESRRLEFSTDIDWKELHRLLKVAFPVDVYAEDGINEMQFGFVKRPTHRSRAYEQDRFEVCNHRYSALCDNAHGAAVLNDCKYGISMNGNALELTLLRAAAAPELRADNRKHHFTYAFTAWEGSFADCDVVRQGYELNVAPLVLEGSTKAFSAFDVDKDNVILETCKPAEDGSGDLILRLYESKKAAGTAKVTCRLGDFTAQECDMLENPLSDLAVCDGGMNLSFRAFEIKTIRLHFA